MPDAQWPLFDLRIRTPRLEIRLPTDPDLYRLNDLVDLGIHEPSAMPFTIPWTDTPPPRRHRESLKFWWSARANWSPESWSFTGAVFVDGAPVGVQDLMAPSSPASGRSKPGPGSVASTRVRVSGRRCELPSCIWLLKASGQSKPLAERFTTTGHRWQRQGPWDTPRTATDSCCDGTGQIGFLI